MADPKDVVLRPEVAFWVRGCLMRDMHNESRGSGKVPPAFAQELLAVLAEAAGLADSTVSAGGSTLATLVPTSWVTTREAAAQLGVSERRIRQLAHSHSIRARLFGREWQIDPDSLTRRTA
jgi:excisionase family DNA binding protein